MASTTTNAAAEHSESSEVTEEGSVFSPIEDQLTGHKDYDFEDDSEEEPSFPFEYRGRTVAGASGTRKSELKNVKPTPTTNKGDASTNKSSENKNSVKKDSTKGNKGGK